MEFCIKIEFLMYSIIMIQFLTLSVLFVCVCGIYNYSACAIWYVVVYFYSPEVDVSFLLIYILFGNEQLHKIIYICS